MATVSNATLYFEPYVDEIHTYTVMGGCRLWHSYFEWQSLVWRAGSGVDASVGLISSLYDRHGGLLSVQRSTHTHIHIQIFQVKAFEVASGSSRNKSCLTNN